MTLTAILNAFKNPHVTCAVIVTVVVLWAVLFYGPGKFDEGVAHEKAAAFALAQKLIEDMEQNNDELKNLSTRDLCIELGGLPNDCAN